MTIWEKFIDFFFSDYEPDYEEVKPNKPAKKGDRIIVSLEDKPDVVYEFFPDKEVFIAMSRRDAEEADLVDRRSSDIKAKEEQSTSKSRSQENSFADGKVDERHVAGEKNSYDELMDMVGLHEVKTALRQITAYYEMQMSYHGGFGELPTLHMVFAGDAGTGKTEVASRFASILYEIGVFKQCKFTVATRADIIDRYMGGTSPRIQALFRKAADGVLLIDEAYSLHDSVCGEYGDEAIAQILIEMEKYRERLIVIFAGYTDKMRDFLRINPGFQSRVKYVIEFESYSEDELYQILKNMAGDGGYSLASGVKEQVLPIFAEARQERDFGNGRFVRSLFERALFTHADRIMQLPKDDVKNDMVMTLTMEDFTK